MGILKGSNVPFYNYEVSDIVQKNLIDRYQYGLLEQGAYTIISQDLPTSGLTYLKNTVSDEFPSRVWETFGPGIIWQTDISNDIFQPSGLFLNNTFLPTTTTGASGYYIDYTRGRVVFNSQVSGVVQMNYCIPHIAIYPGDSKQWRTILNTVQDNYLNLDINSPSGIAEKVKQDRVWLPCVVVEAKSTKYSPLQLGGGDFAQIGVFNYIFSDKPFSNKRLYDMISLQKETNFCLYDVNKAPISLDYQGILNPSGQTYKQLSLRESDYFWTYAFIKESNGAIPEPIFDLFRGEVRQIVEVSRYLVTYS